MDRREAVSKAIAELARAGDGYVSRLQYERHRKANPDLGLPAAQTAVRWFGSWAAVCDSAGVPSFGSTSVQSAFYRASELALELLRGAGHDQEAAQLEQEVYETKVRRGATITSADDLDAVLDWDS